MILVDTSVWSLAFRHDLAAESPARAHVERLRQALANREAVCVMGIIVQELLQGFGGPKAAEDLLSRLASLPWLEPARADYIGAADLRNQCRRRGVQLGTVDALIAQVCLHHELTLLTFDRDFVHASSFVPLQVWAA